MSNSMRNKSILGELFEPQTDNYKIMLLNAFDVAVKRTPSMVYTVFDVVAFAADDPSVAVRSQSLQTIRNCVEHTVDLSEKMLEIACRATLSEDFEVRISAFQAIAAIAKHQPRYAKISLPFLLVGRGDSEVDVRNAATIGQFDVLQQNPELVNSYTVEDMIKTASTDERRLVVFNALDSLSAIMTTRSEFATPEAVHDIVTISATNDDKAVRKEALRLLTVVVKQNPQLASEQMVDSAIKGASEQYDTFLNRSAMSLLVTIGEKRKALLSKPEMTAFFVVAAESSDVFVSNHASKLLHVIEQKIEADGLSPQRPLAIPVAVSPDKKSVPGS